MNCVRHLPPHVDIDDDMDFLLLWQFPQGTFLLIQQDLNRRIHLDLTG